MDKVTIYTDGACSGNPGPGGWAAILLYNDAKKEISGGKKETTNNEMEMTAVLEALKILKRPCEVMIYSDSAYVVNTFDKGWIYNWAKNDWTKKIIITKKKLNEETGEVETKKDRKKRANKNRSFGKQFILFVKFIKLLLTKLRDILMLNLIIDVTNLQEERLEK